MKGKQGDAVFGDVRWIGEELEWCNILLRYSPLVAWEKSRGSGIFASALESSSLLCLTRSTQTRQVPNGHQLRRYSWMASRLKQKHGQYASNGLVGSAGLRRSEQETSDPWKGCATIFY